MKIEIDERKPESFQEDWPGQWEVFSHFEMASGVPSVLFMVTTLKENGKPNACFQAWSSFAGDSAGFFAIIAGLLKHTHTYSNILRDREFCVNFLGSEYYKNCLSTIEHNGESDDELAAGGFTAEPAKTVKAPRIQEAFLTYECTLEREMDLAGAGISAVIVGRVRHAAVNEGFSSVQAICGPDGFMFNVHCPKDPRTGEGKDSAVARLHPVKLHTS